MSGLWNHTVAVRGGRRQDAVISQLMCSRRRDPCGKPGRQFFRFQNDVRCSIVPRRAQRICEATIGEFFESLDGHGGARRIAADAC